VTSVINIGGDVTVTIGSDAGQHSCSICLHQQPSKGLETTPWSSATNVASYHRERPPRTEYGTVDCLIGSTHRIVFGGEKSWKQLRSSRGTRHDDDEWYSFSV